MNERIRLLAEQAGFFPDPNWDHTDWHAAGHSDLFEKFAHLIVFECVNAVMDGTKEGDHYAQLIEQHFDNGDGGILHFGVEE